MGRRKVSLKFISDKKSRQSSFLKRSKRLQEKTNELQELGGIDTLLICYDEQGLLKTWPEAPPDIHRIISRYYSVNEVQRKRCTQSLPNFCGHKGNKSEQEQSFPISDGQLDGLLEKIQQEIAALDDKSNVVREKIESIKRSMNQSELVIPHSQSDHGNISYAPIFDPISLNYTSSVIYQHEDMGLLDPCSPMSMQIKQSELVIPYSQSDHSNINCALTFDFNNSVSMNYTSSSIHQHDDMGLPYPCSPMSMQMKQSELVIPHSQSDHSNISYAPIFDFNDSVSMNYTSSIYQHDDMGLPYLCSPMNLQMKQSELVIPHSQSDHNNISYASTFDFNDSVSMNYTSSIYQHDDIGLPYLCSPMSMQMNQSELVIPHSQSDHSNISCAPTFDFNDAVSMNYTSSSIYQYDDMGLPYPCSPMSMQTNQSELVIPHSQSDHSNISCAPTFDFNDPVSMNYTSSPIYQYDDMGLPYPCSPMSMQFTKFPDFFDDFLADVSLSDLLDFYASDWWDMEYSDNAIDNNNDGLRSSEVGAPDVVGSGDPSALQLPNISPSKTTSESFQAIK